MIRRQLNSVLVSNRMLRTLVITHNALHIFLKIRPSTQESRRSAVSTNISGSFAKPGHQTTVGTYLKGNYSPLAMFDPLT